MDYNFVLTRFGRQHLLMKLFDEAAEHALINFEFLAILQSVSIQHQLGLDIFALLGLALKYGQKNLEISTRIFINQFTEDFAEHISVLSGASLEETVGTDPALLSWVSENFGSESEVQQAIKIVKDFS